MAVMAVTVKDVAERAGVTPTVVSRVLHNKATSIRVSEATAQRVRDAAKELGYQVNAVARAFRERSTRTLALAHESGHSRPRLSGQPAYFATMVDGVIDAAFSAGYSITLCPKHIGDSAEGIAADGRFDGVLWYGTFIQEFRIAAVESARIPVVVLQVDAASVQGRVPSVICDNDQGIRLAVEHLRELGHTRLAMATYGPEMYGEARLRREAFLRHASELGLEAELLNLGFEGREAAAWIGSRPAATAVIGENDSLAFAVMRAAQAAGMRVPDDLSVVGFDSLPNCEACSPALTSVYQPLYDIGFRGAETLLTMLRGESADFEQVLPCRLDIRASTARPRR